MTELVECNTQLHKTLQGLWSDALTQHKLQQQQHASIFTHLLKTQAVALEKTSEGVNGAATAELS